MNPEDAVRAALHAGAERFAPSPAAWSENRARVRRRTRARHVTTAAASVVAVGVAGTVAVALPRSDRSVVRPVSPSASASASAAPRVVHPFHEPDLRGMNPAEAQALAQRCVRSFQDPQQELPGTGLEEPPGDYRLLYVLPANAERMRVYGHVLAMHAGDQLLECHTTLDSPGVGHWERLAPNWLTDRVDGGPRTTGSTGEWSASGRYTAEIATIDIEPVEGDPRIDAIMDNGFWFATGTATRSTITAEARRPVYPRVRSYAHDGTLLYDSMAARRGTLCYRLPDGSTSDGLEPTTRTDCVPAYPWP